MGFRKLLIRRLQGDSRAPPWGHYLELPMPENTFHKKKNGGSQILPEKKEYLGENFSGVGIGMAVDAVTQPNLNRKENRT